MSLAASGAIAYGVASAAFLLLSLALVSRWTGRARGSRLIVASLATACWAAVLAHAAWTGLEGGSAASFAGLVRDVAWLLVLTGLMERQAPWQTLSRLSLGITVGAIVLAVAQLLAGPGWMLANSGLRIADTGEMALSLLAVVLLEQLYRNASPDGRRTLKFLVLGVGILLAYDLFLYSEVLLLGRVEPLSWLARALACTAAVPLIALAAYRNPEWSLNALVSRHVAFHMTSFLGIAAYLLLLMGSGHLADSIGDAWARIIHTSLFAVVGAAFVSLTASSRLRRRLRVFLGKYIYRYKYDYRIEWLRFIETLSQPETQSDVRGNAVRSMAQIIGSPGGLLFLADDSAGGFVAAAAWPNRDAAAPAMPQIGHDQDLPQFLMRRQWVVDLKEQARSPGKYDNMTVPRDLDSAAGFRIVVPLMLGQQLFGFTVLADPPVPFETTYEDRDLLKTVGLDVAMRLARHEADRQLAESRQFEAYHRLTAFVMHDLKNLAAQLSLVVSNAERHRRNPEFVDDAIGTIAHSAARMRRLIEQLQGRPLQPNLRRTRLLDIARDACQRCSAGRPLPRLSAADEDVCLAADPERLGMMVEHLIRNAQDATDDDGEIGVSVRRERDSETDFAILSVSDTGVGMTPEFVRERLFQPFDSTKGPEGMGIGAYQVREYVQGLGGRIEVRSVPGEGTTVTLRFPACA